MLKGFCLQFVGRKVAVDASMSLYQFLIAVRSDGAQLTGIDGETTRYIDEVQVCCACTCTYNKGVCGYHNLISNVDVRQGCDLGQ